MIAKLSFPLFVNMKVYMSISDYQPFVSFSTGGLLSKKLIIYNANSNSLFAEPSVGIDLRRTDKLSISIQAGCMFHRWVDGYFSEYRLAVTPSLKLGLTF